MRRYRTMRTRAADIDANTDAENYLARTVHEDTDPRDTGLLDWTGTKIYAVSEIEPIGFVRHDCCT